MVDPDPNHPTETHYYKYPLKSQEVIGIMTAAKQKVF